MARLPSAARRSSSGRPRSSNAPSTMSPDAPEKQSKYTVFGNSDEPFLFQAAVPHVRQDHMIDDIDAHQHTRGHETPCELHILGARFRIARRMIVKQHECSGARRRRFPEDLSRMDDAGIERSDR